MPSRRLWVRTIIDSVHALAAGGTPGAAVALWVVRSGAQASLSAAQFSALTRSWTPLLLVPLFCLAMLVVTGLLRLGHRTAHVTPAAMGPRARAAWIEHGVFVALTALATAALFVLIQP